MHDPPACGIRSANHQPMSQQWENSKPIGSKVGDCDEGSSWYCFTGEFARCMGEVSTNSADIVLGMVILSGRRTDVLRWTQSILF